MALFNVYITVPKLTATEKALRFCHSICLPIVANDYQQAVTIARIKICFTFAHGKRATYHVKLFDILNHKIN